MSPGPLPQWAAPARSALLACALACLPALAPAAALVVPAYPADLSSVERLYHSAQYQVQVRPHGAGEDAWRRATVFETRNDWLVQDYFNSDRARRADVLQPAAQVGLSGVIPGRLDTGKADMQTASFSPFSFEGMAVDVRIRLLRPGARALGVTVRPLRRAIPAAISADGSTVELTLERPQKLSVEINDRLNPLFLFADAPDVPDLDATYYFGPGLHRLPGDGTLELRSHERVYIAAGAIVEGRFRLAAGSGHVTIRGRGLLSGGKWGALKVEPAWQYKMAAIGTEGSHHFTLEGITLVQSTTWQVAIEDMSPGGDATHDNQYRNFKTVSWNGCTDGIWVTGDRNVVDDVFIFNNDDFFVTKGGRGTRVSNAVVWGGSWGRVLLLHNIYRHTRPVEDLVLEHIDVIGKEGARVLFFVETYATPARRISKPMRNVLIRDVVVEERRRTGNSNNVPYNKAMLFDFDTSVSPGAIDGLTFEDIVLDQWLPDEGQFLGTAASPIRGLTLRNVRAGGTRLGAHGFMPLRFNEHVEGLRVE